MQDVRLYDSLRSRMPSARAHLEPNMEHAFLPRRPESEAPSLGAPESTADMERSDADATVGNEPMDE